MLFNMYFQYNLCSIKTQHFFTEFVLSCMSSYDSAFMVSKLCIFIYHDRCNYIPLAFAPLLSYNQDIDGLMDQKTCLNTIFYI